ncbi:MAG: response regulator [Phycisphaerae bacterium]|nr:response regulator [Phycisphaerae bacterium]
MNPPRRILVCDDEPHIFLVVSTKLRNAGFEVMTAQDGAEGLQLARTHQPHLVVTDYQMPVMSGLELASRLRLQIETATTPLIMLTARGFSIEPADVAKTNIRVVLPKPFSPRELLTTVQRVLDESGAARPVPAATAAGGSV